MMAVKIIVMMIKTTVIMAVKMSDDNKDYGDDGSENYSHDDKVPINDNGRDNNSDDGGGDCDDYDDHYQS